MIGPVWPSQEKKEREPHFPLIFLPEISTPFLCHFFQQELQRSSLLISLSLVFLSHSHSLFYSLSPRISLFLSLDELMTTMRSMNSLSLSQAATRSREGSSHGADGLEGSSVEANSQRCRCRCMKRMWPSHGFPVLDRRLRPPPPPVQCPIRHLLTSSSQYCPLFRMKMPGSLAHVSMQKI